MTLSEALASQISHNARARGFAYFATGAVRSLTAESGVIEAAVRGTETYTVWLHADGARLRGSCTCAYFDDRFTMCKHIWAVILAAEAQSLPLLAPGVEPEEVEFEPEEPGGNSVDEPLDDDEPFDASVEAQKRLAWARARFSAERPHQPPALLNRPTPAPPARWRTVLDSVANPRTTGVPVVPP